MISDAARTGRYFLKKCTTFRTFLGQGVMVIEGTKGQPGQDLNLWLTSPNSEVLHGIPNTGQLVALGTLRNVKMRKESFKNRRRSKAEKDKNQF
jgi:hypothetical protein